MDTGSIALTLVLILISMYTMQQARQKGVKFKWWLIVLVIISAMIVGLAPFAYIIWKHCTNTGPFGGC